MTDDTPLGAEYARPLTETERPPLPTTEGWHTDPDGLSYFINETGHIEPGTRHFNARLTAPEGSDLRCPDCGERITALVLAPSGVYADVEPCDHIVHRNEVERLFRTGGSDGGGS